MERVKEKAVLMDTERRIDIIDKKLVTTIRFCVGAYFHRRNSRWGLFGISVRYRPERAKESFRKFQVRFGRFLPTTRTSYGTARTRMDANTVLGVRFMSVVSRPLKLQSQKTFGKNNIYKTSFNRAAKG